MIEMKPNALYTRSDLAEMLKPLGIDPDAWIRRIRPVKRFRQAWWGAYLIRAIEVAPALSEQDGKVPVLPAARGRGGRRGRMGHEPGKKLVQTFCRKDQDEK